MIEKISHTNEPTSKISLDAIIDGLINQENILRILIFLFIVNFLWALTESDKPLVHSKQVKLSENECFNIHHCSIWPTDPSLIIDTTGILFTLYV